MIEDIFSRGRCVQTNRHYLPEEVDWTLVKGHSDGGEDDKLEEEAKEEGDEAHQQGHRDHSLASKLCPLSKSVSQGCPTLCWNKNNEMEIINKVLTWRIQEASIRPPLAMTRHRYRPVADVYSSYTLEQL